MRNRARVLLFIPAVVLIAGLCLHRAAHSQDALEAWLAGEDWAPAPDQEAPPSEDVLIRYWEPDNLTRIGREWQYLLEQAQAARELLGEDELLGRIEAEAERVVAACGPLHPSRQYRVDGDESLLRHTEELAARLARHRAALNALVTDTPVASVSWTEPYTRHEPAALPPATPVREWEIPALANEHHAAAILVVNSTDERRSGSVRIAGLDPARITCEVRQHVFVEDWYRRQTRRTGDPLTLLEQTDGEWRFDLHPGGIVKLHLDIHVLEAARETARAAVSVVLTGAEPHVLDLTLRTAPVAAPVTEFQHLAFMYHTVGVHGRMPQVTAADLAAHRVEMFEFIRTPPSEFDAEGNLLSADFSAHERYLDAYLPHGLRPMIFWIDPLRMPDGEEIPRPSAMWARAFSNLLRAFLDRMQELGYGPEHFVLMPVDEPHGGGYDGGEPSEHIKQWAEALEIIKQAVPELPVVMTITYYASAPVVEAFAANVDVFVPQWPWLERLPRHAPPDYNPRVAFDEQIMPMMEKERRNRGASIISYTVASGPTHGLLWGNRAFPIIAFGKGFTGVSHWAYNDSRGSTWHPWDGPRQVNLDYIFVYDGTEDHPFNRAWNPTGETLVPSIRWRALRAGIQDAHLLMWLQDAVEEGRLQGQLARRAREAVYEARAIAEEETPLTDADIARLSRELREIYIAAAG